MEIPKTLTREQRLEAADLIIEKIFDRTNRGINKDGDRFPGYSKAYIDSLDFENSGKSKGKVNLQLSGDMLAAMELLDHTDGKLKIGYDSGADEAGRAEGNILGSYGGEPNKKKARDFLGLPPNELKKIIELVKAK